MKTLLSKICPVCNTEFNYEAWNKKRIFCSRTCKDIHGRGNKTSKTEWVKKAQEKHGEFYNYELVDLENRIDNKVKIVCKIHGEYLQNPTQHILGKGCKKCADKKQFLTNKEFIEKSTSKHKGRYTYEHTEYKSMKDHVIITCPEHGNFSQSPTQHLHHGAGCLICAQIYTISKGEKLWLNEQLVPDDKSHRQVVIIDKNKKFIVDGLFENTVYEYLGDFWHGNPNIYSGDDFNVLAKKTYGELYRETLQRFRDLKLLGYNIKFIWESEWKLRKK